ncbi:NAD(+)/NADH kinase [Gordonibacter massiliensis (ex Traore et al. 2017)]|uniref:NAD kinase n=1 Tax=Gordonibacter massiliensis (ex Traore et al. 2017) TaxID=1841863 RepID=A0A842JHQ4_9ACTN|nr:NAD(+)/NADH kinase [Gordonibacter massiliensis (ex Traore et al. 2017)]MBC2888799.1 NAD(+)/NADH kinase [Gordonibacter massiliensis (ex Traore et al. 2017)]
MHILIVRNNSNSKAVDASLLLATYLATQGADYTLVNSSDLSCQGDHEELNAALASGVEMAVVLGGDGTILRTAQQIGTSGVPILGMNFGRLGFLANTSEEGVVSAVAAALAGDVVAEQRTNLQIDVVCEGEPDPWCDDGDCHPERGADPSCHPAHGDPLCHPERSAQRGVEGSPAAPAGLAPSCHPERSAQRGVEGSPAAPADPAPATPLRTFFALNELAVTRGAHGRIIDFGLGVSGAHIADMRGDGLVVATATGSTAYALSAGGPLVSPGFTGLVVVPLAPHTLHSRAIVTASNDVVEMDLSRNAETREATLFVDGELLVFDRTVRRVYIRRGDAPTVLLRYQREGFYEHAARVFF